MKLSFSWKKILSICFIILLIIAVSIYMVGKSKEDSYISDTDLFFDTVVTIQLYGTKDSTILKECFQKCTDYENLFSTTLEGSEIYQINHSGGKPVEVSDETLHLIQEGLSYSAQSKGTFDITIGSLSSLWDFKNNPGILPSKEEIEDAKGHVGFENIVINGNTVTLLDPGTSIDLGGIAKGYIADRLKDYLHEKGVKHALINLGGNVLALGGKDDTTPFRIGIQKPFEEDGEALLGLDVTDRSVVSSGIYQRFIQVDHKLYHHLLNPATGYPFENNLYGVTILSYSSVEGDALSTTCFGLGLKKGMEYIESIPGVDAIFVTDENQIFQTSGIK